MSTNAKDSLQVETLQEALAETSQLLVAAQEEVAKANSERDGALLEAQAAVEALNKLASQQAAAAVAVEPTTQESGHFVLIHRHLVEAVEGTDENGRPYHYLNGSINGKPFRVKCDVQVEVPHDVYQALLPVMAKINAPHSVLTDAPTPPLYG